MKPTEEFADTHRDFAGDESTSVMGVDLLSSLTERSRQIDVAAPPVPESEISIGVEEPEPVTTMSPAARPQLLIADDAYPALGDEESTVMMEEPEPTTVAVRSHLHRPPPPHEPLPAPLLAAQPLPAQSVPDPQWAAELAPRALVTIRVAPLPAPELVTTPESSSKPAVGSRRLSALAAVALGVAAWTLGLGHHEVLPTSAILSPAPSVSSVLLTPWGLQTQAKVTLDNVRAALGSLLQWSASVASARNESEDPGRAKHRPAAPHHQRR
jgi:hypothetical protein